MSIKTMGDRNSHLSLYCLSEPPISSIECGEQRNCYDNLGEREIRYVYNYYSLDFIKEYRCKRSGLPLRDKYNTITMIAEKAKYNKVKSLIDFTNEKELHQYDEVFYPSDEDEFYLERGIS